MKSNQAKGKALVRGKHLVEREQGVKTVGHEEDANTENQGGKAGALGPPGGSQKGGGEQNQATGRRIISEADKVQWALERYGSLGGGEHPKRVIDIARKYNRKPAIVTRGIQEAFRKRWVELVERPRPLPSVDRDKELETALEKRYPFLRAAIVFKVGNLATLDPSRQTDATHRRGGEAFARFLSAAVGMFRPGDVIGFGSGRAVYWTVEALRRLPQLRVRGIVLASVTGFLHARDHAGELAAVCDGDFHSSLASMSVVTPQPEMRLMTTHLACSREQREKEFRETWLGGSQWERSPVSHLICGTGVLVKGHRLHLSARPGTEEWELEQSGLEPIAPQLRALSKIADEITVHHQGYYPVGDICNFLFYIENTAVTEHRKEIRDLVADVNSCLLNVQEEHLFRVGSIMLIAGTAKKRGAIAQLLTPDPFRRGGGEKRKLNIEYLCVDDETTAWLVGRTPSPFPD